jgi:hypothetical protein
MTDDQARRGSPGASGDPADDLEAVDLSELLIEEEIANDCRGDRAAEPVPPPRPASEEEPAMSMPAHSPEPDREPTIVDWAIEQRPGLTVVSASEPAPKLLDHNIVAVVDDPHLARSVLRDWERIEHHDGAVGLVAMGYPNVAEGVDPEHVTGHAAERIAKGGIPGALVGAVVVGLIVFIANGWSTAAWGAVLGGAAFGFVAGGMLSFATGTSWGAAYEHAFVADDDVSVVFASIHSDSTEPIAQAIKSASHYDGVALYEVGRRGEVAPLSRPPG